MANDELGIGGTFAVVTLGALVCLVLGSIVVTDYNRVETYEPRVCSGSLLLSDVHTSGIKCARGKAITTFGTTRTASSFNQTVELFYPAVNWLIVCKKTSDVEDWLAGMSSATTFNCLVDHPADHTGVPDGVRTNFDQIGGWLAMMVLSALYFLALVCVLGYWWWDGRSRR